jgi:hypothetical protein
VWFGSAPAVLSLAVVLFLPSLFFWSVSALRESIHFLLVTVVMVGGLQATTAGERWGRRLVWGALAIGAVLALRDLRAGSMLIVGGALAVGLIVGWLASRPRMLVAACVLAVLAAGVAISRPQVQQQLFATVRANAMNHQGHVWTPGLHYKLLEPEFYVERTDNVMDAMTRLDAVRYVVRALVAAAVVPLPWHAQSSLTRAYIPEHVIWLFLAAIFPLGVWIGWRVHPTATAVLTVYIVLISVGVALRSGNVGTLVRHRGLVLPFVMCVAAIAICHWLARKGPATDERSLSIGGSLRRTG